MLVGLRFRLPVARTLPGFGSALRTIKKRTIFVHVGLHKTGSTALQKMISDNSETFLKDGYLYPKVGQRYEPTRSLGHHCLAWSLYREPSLLSLWAELREEIIGSRARNVLLSSEEFEFVRQPGGFQRMRDEFADANFRVVCYLRRQDELLESEYNQHVKQGGVKDHRQFMSIMMPRLDYSRYLQVLQTAFGVRNIIVRVYEKAQLEGDLYDDFFRCLGLKVRSDYTRPGRPVNPSLSAAGLALMRLLNQHITDELLLKQLRRCVLQHYSSEPFKHEGTILSTRERHSLVERFAPSNAEIARQYMGRRDGTLFSDEIADIEAPAGPKEVCEPVVGLLEKHLSRRPYDTGARDALRLIRSAQPNHAFSHAPLLLDVDDSP